MKKKKICIDADYLLFQVCEGKNIKQNTFANEQVDLAPFKKRFKVLIKELEGEVAVEYLGKLKIKGKAKILLSDPEGNFRYSLLPTYKGGREASTRSELFYRMRTWALKKYGYVKGVEADDVYGYYVGEKGYLGCSMDKDCLKSVAGDHFDVYHSRRHSVTTGELEARHFTLLQTLMGDPVDDIKALPKDAEYDMIPLDVLPEGRKKQPFKVTEKLAVELLDEFGWNWDGVVAAYKSKDIPREKAVLNRRLVDLHQWNPKDGLTLWEPKLP